MDKCEIFNYTATSRYEKNIDEVFLLVAKIIGTAVKATNSFRIEKMNISDAQCSFQTNDPANAV